VDCKPRNAADVDLRPEKEGEGDLDIRIEYPARVHEGVSDTTKLSLGLVTGDLSNRLVEGLTSSCLTVYIEIGSSSSSSELLNNVNSGDSLTDGRVSFILR
jgi:hypothetical protein